MHKSLFTLLLLSSLLSCRQNLNHAEQETTLVFREIPTPVEEGGEPNIFVANDGQVFLSWVEYLNDSTDALLFSRFEHEQWSSPRVIAKGTDWFVNWADFPSIASFKDSPESMAAHWLQKSAEGTYDYDVRVALSKDSGKSWSNSFIPHTDGISAEHGFVTLLPLHNGNIFATWLDGRNTKGGEEHSETHGHGGGGAMTLRTAEIDKKGSLHQEAELDSRVCDCCQTDAALTSAGPVVVYRDRSEKEVRDISIVRKVNGNWTTPKKVFDDNWEIKGCPVNGPAIVAKDQTIAVAWFTAANSKNQVKVAFSNDAGATFLPPTLIDDGKPIGRVDIIMLKDDTALVSWIEDIGETAEIRLAKVNVKGKIGTSITATTISASRQSGFPVLEQANDRILLAWTQVDSINTIRTMSLSN